MKSKIFAYFTFGSSWKGAKKRSTILKIALTFTVLTTVIFFQNASNISNWTQITGTLSQIAAGSDGTVWGVNSAGIIYKYNGNTWTTVTGTLSQVAVGSASNVWGVNSAGKVYKYSNNTWALVSGTLKQVSVASDGTVWGVNSAGIIYKYNGNTWTTVTGTLSQVAVGSASNVWGVNSAGKVYKYSNNTWALVSGTLKQVSVASDGTVWGVNSAGIIYKYNGNTWTTVTGTLSQVAVGSASNVWGVNSAGNIYQYSATSTPPPTPTPTGDGDGHVTSFTLINLATGAAVSGYNPITIPSGATSAPINLTSIGTTNLGIRANTNAAVGSVGFKIDGTYLHSENSPYTLCNGAADLSHDCAEVFANGAHTLSGQAFSEAALNGTAAANYQISYTVSGAVTAAVVSVTDVTGSLVHEKSITITGVNFGTKTTGAPTNPAAPYIWDNASGASPTAKWDFILPNQNDAAFQMQYRTPSQVTLQSGNGTGIALPHSHDTKYLAGAHYCSPGLCPPTSVLPMGIGNNSGEEVAAGKNNQQGNPYTYVTYYRAIDPHWHLNTTTNTPSCLTTAPSLCDHNLKEYDYAEGTGDYGDWHEWYCGQGSGANLLGNSAFGCNYTGQITGSLFSANANILNWYPYDGTLFSQIKLEGPGDPTPPGPWQRIELIIKHASVGGYHVVYQNNTLIWDVNLNDDVRGSIVTPDRSEIVAGGYARDYGTSAVYQNNWRYYADVYYDHSLARVMLANSPNYATATLIEPQILTTWSNGQITASVNLGKFENQVGQTAYLFVFNASNTHNAVGFPVKISGP